MNRLCKTALALVSLLALLLVGCAESSDLQERKTMENPKLNPLTPEQVLEYIEIFHLESDINREQILTGERFILTATDETADLLFRVNFFTAGLHRVAIQGDFPQNPEPWLGLISYMSREFFEAYRSAIIARERYVSWLTAHWGYFTHPFLRTEHVESFPAEIYSFYKSIPDEIIHRIYKEVDGMSLMNYIDLLWHYSLNWDNGFWAEFDGTGSIGRHEGTDNQIAITSRLIWENPRCYKGKELMQEFGLSDENPMTFEWVLSNPKEAYSIATTLWDPLHIFDVHVFSDSFFEEWNIPFFPPDKGLR